MRQQLMGDDEGVCVTILIGTCCCCCCCRCLAGFAARFMLLLLLWCVSVSLLEGLFEVRPVLEGGWDV
jgi:hypothetical protein